MLHALIALTLPFLTTEPPTHDRNPIFRAVLDEGVSAGDERVKLPAPTFRDGQTAAEQRAALEGIAGSKRAADEMLQLSLSAPHRLRLRDGKAQGATIRQGDLYFALRRVDLDAIRPAEAFRRLRGESFEAANMRFEARVMETGERSDHEWLTHATGRLLDRIRVESTDRVFASRSDDSLILASRTDPDRGATSPEPNAWRTIRTTARGDVLGDPQPFAGGCGYVKMTRLKGERDALLVEVHFAFVEPTGWFDGAPILRSKFGLIAQDQVRRLRRELAKSGGEDRRPPSPSADSTAEVQPRALRGPSRRPRADSALSESRPSPASAGRDPGTMESLFRK